jgi:hypothetical protein
VTVCCNLKLKDTVSAIRDFSGGDHSEFDMSVVAVMSHGESGTFLTTDERRITEDWILQQESIL